MLIRIDLSRPIASCRMPLFQSEAKCEAINMKMIFHSDVNKRIFTRKVFQPRLESESFLNSELG